MVMRVTHYDEPVLRQEGARITEFDDDLRQLVVDMVETMYEAEGIGLAAQQIGRAIQLCVIDPQLPPGEVPFDYLLDGKQPPVEFLFPLALCNPVVTELPGPQLAYEEGCLSFPDIRGDIIRPAVVRCVYQDVEGHTHTLDCDGILARVIQHEVDHLHGKLFIDLKA